ncbi:sulfite exporter TauE/SafE family protein [Kitasatospora sp. CM 4170]|uniref:Probable membrane transporter protein n=1 Tax=Kitasatospora aburaviensis TaxID=67265 RepID=A0ABW1F9D9_9ACTN|nr:sulfite exporter TauE/SafE family protein [Kitasatospora sp. CM 4170]WNM49474.1 sulfite exporter TauE/SafE family protein [Kitasatospora sp. CM 4170]
MSTLAIAASLLIGVLLGILGGGGSMLTVPILVYLAGQDTKQAITTSLFVVGVTSIAGLISHARAGRVRWRTGTLFGLAGMAGAYAGGRAAAHIPDTVLLIAFALMMLATAAAMLRGPRKTTQQAQSEPPLHRLLLQGLVVGAVTGILGAGGGFLIVPALALLAGLPMGIAIGTSLLVIAMNSFAGLAGHISGAHLDWNLALAVTAAAVLGSLIGGRYAGRIPQHTLRTGFGWFVIAMALFVLGRQIGPAVLTVVPAIAAWVLIRRRRVRRTGNPSAAGAVAPTPEPAVRH